MYYCIPISVVPCPTVTCASLILLSTLLLLLELLCSMLPLLPLRAYHRPFHQLHRLLRAMSVEIEDSHKVLCAERSSVGIAVEEGKDYWWCSCGRSKNQPFCDGSHVGTDFGPKVSFRLWLVRSLKTSRSTPRLSRRTCTSVFLSL